MVKQFLKTISDMTNIYHNQNIDTKAIHSSITKYGVISNDGMETWWHLQEDIVAVGNNIVRISNTMYMQNKRAFEK